MYYTHYMYVSSTVLDINLKVLDVPDKGLYLMRSVESFLLLLSQ